MKQAFPKSHPCFNWWETTSIHSSLLTRISSPVSPEYNTLLSSLPQCEDASRLRSAFDALALWSSLLAKHHEGFSELLELLFHFDWRVEDEGVMDSFENVLVSLVSADAGFLDPIFRLVVSNFVGESGKEGGGGGVVGENMGGDGVPPGVQDGDELGDFHNGGTGDGRTVQEKQDAMRIDHLHKTIQRILRVNPMGCTALLPVMIDSFPRERMSVECQVGFLKQALRVGDYVPVLRDRLLNVAIERILDLDVRLSFENEDETMVGSALFSMEIEEPSGNSNKRSRIDQDNSELAEKVDALLCTLFDYLDSKEKKSKTMFKSALQSFERLILRTGRAKTCQFFLFYACRSKSSFIKSFLELLENAIEDEGEDLQVRRSAANFLGSFLARAKFIKNKIVKCALERACAWVYREYSLTPKSTTVAISASSSSSNASARKERRRKNRTVVDATFQAIIYALLFKGKHLGGMEFVLNELNGWDELTNGDMDCPLMRVPKEIREEYWSFCAREGGGDFYKTTDLNKRRKSTPPPRLAAMEDLDATMNSERAVRLENQSFPFDPLVLSKSAKRLEPLYQSWVALDDDDSEDDEDGISDSSGSSSENDDDKDDDDEDETMLSDERLLRGTLPQPIRIARIKRLLGVQFEDSPGIASNAFPSLTLKAAPMAICVAARDRTLSRLSYDSGLAGSW